MHQSTVAGILCSSGGEDGPPGFQVRDGRHHMSEQENRDTLERYFQAFGRQDLDTLDDLIHDD